MKKFTVHQFNQMFHDEETCLDAVRDMLYPEGIVCRSCQEVTAHYRLKGRKAYSCQYCGTQVYPLAGTIFEKSSTPLKSWFYAMYLMASTRTGISAKQLERELGVTYKTAWRMFKQIRSILNEDVDLGGLLVEVDETYIGGKAKNMHKAKRERLGGRGTAGKQPVFGMVERKGKVITKVVPDVSRKTLLPNIREKVLPSSLVLSQLGFEICLRKGPIELSCLVGSVDGGGGSDGQGQIRGAAGTGTTGRAPATDPGWQKLSPSDR